MQNKFLVLLVVVVFSSCSQKQSQQKQVLDFGRFTIETPIGWTKIKEQGTDSYVGRIAIDETDTLEFDLGWYSWDLKEYEELNIDGKKFYMSATDTAKNVAFVDSSQINKVVKSNVVFATIDNRKAKILFPIKAGIGTTGVYFDSLWLAGSNIDKFNLYGMNLKATNEKAVLNAFKTLKFIRRK